MATSTWKLKSGTGNWSDTADWTTAPPAPGGDVVIGSTHDIGSVFVTEDVSIGINSLTIGAKHGRNGNTTTLAVTPSAILTVNGTISLGVNTIIDGTGMLSANGAVSGGGTIAATGGLFILSGTGSIAGGGVLDLASNVTSASTSYDIDAVSGSVLELAGTAAAGTTVAFLGSLGTLELADIAGGLVQGFNGTIAGLSIGSSGTVPTNAVNIQAPITSASLSGSQITVLNGTTTVATLQLSAVSGSAYAAVAADSALGGYDVFLTSVAPANPTVTWSPSMESGVEGQAIALGTITPSGGSGSFSSVLVSGIPVGATLADATHSFTASSGGTSVNILGWNYAGLSITPPNDANVSLSVQVTDTAGNTSASAGETVTVNPLAPTVSWGAATAATEGTALALGTLAATVNSRSGDANSLQSLVVSAIPVGAVLSDGAGGHSFTATSTNTAVDVKSWTLSSLKIKTTNDINFTLTATEVDGDGNTSTASINEAVTVNPLTPTVAPGAVSGSAGQAIALNPSALRSMVSPATPTASIR